MAEIRTLLNGYREFYKKYYTSGNTLYRDLTRQGQSPKTLIIACSDSRVDPSIITEARPGDIFVVGSDGRDDQRRSRRSPGRREGRDCGAGGSGGADTQGGDVVTEGANGSNDLSGPGGASPSNQPATGSSPSRRRTSESERS